MQYELHENYATITCTFGELATMESLDQKIYATPIQGRGTRIPAELYVASKPRFKYDFFFADVENFCEAEGWTSLGAQDMSAEELAAVEDDVHCIDVEF